MLASHHANGDMDDPLVLYQIKEIEEALERGRRESVGLRTIIATPGNRKRLAIVVTVMLGSQLNGASLFTYYLAPVLRESATFRFNSIPDDGLLTRRSSPFQAPSASPTRYSSWASTQGLASGT